MAVTSEEIVKPEGCVGVRHLMVVLMFLSTTVAYATRVSMSVGILAMTDHSSNGNFTVFDWSQTQKDTILSSFFWGYIVLQIPAGVLAARVGGKLLVLLSVLVNGVLNMLVPMAAEKGGWIAVCVCRVLMGLMQGLLYPSLHGLLGQWAPVSERSRMGTFIYAGAQLGTIIAMMLSGILSASRWGWPSIFYVAGVSCFVWSALWLVLGSSSPTQHRWISKQERKFIELSGGTSHLSEHKQLPTPWKKILTSLPFLSILFAHAGQSLGFWTLLTEMPTYMSKVLNVDVKSSGVLSALPYIAMYVLSFVFSWLSEWLVNRGAITLGTSRKLFNTIAFWGPAAALLVLSYLPPGHVQLSVLLLIVCVGLNGAHYVGFLISHIDLSPNYASTLMGITNGMGNVLSIVAPLSVSVIVKDEYAASEWRKVFFLSIALYFLSNLFYLLFMSGNVQDWNEPAADTGKSLEDGKKRKVSNASAAQTTGEERF